MTLGNVLYLIRTFLFSVLLQKIMTKYPYILSCVTYWWNCSENTTYVFLGGAWNCLPGPNFKLFRFDPQFLLSSVTSPTILFLKNRGFISLFFILASLNSEIFIFIIFPKNYPNYMLLLKFPKCKHPFPCLGVYVFKYACTVLGV